MRHHTFSPICFSASFPADKIVLFGYTFYLTAVAEYDEQYSS